ncbi:hypothetical protein M422DRAFT_25145 [Sphaerobolus stellatus SS14]|nr:hypothetical protein M422DRAFT_25145 [Sphaerobolus stellatus SS14]
MSHLPDADVLALPLTLSFSGRSCPNLILKAAITEQLCTMPGGKPTPELERVYAIWGAGRLGIFHTGNIMVHRDHLEAKANAIIDKDVNADWYIPSYTRLQDTVKKAAKAAGYAPPLLIGQLSHMGGEAEHPLIGGVHGTRPSDWTQEGIADIIDRFAYAAGVLHSAGFDGIQIHGAYKNFITLFLSSISNTRTDVYGGTIQNRARVLLEIIDAIQKRVDDSSFVISLKLTSSDFSEGGLSDFELVILCRLLEGAKVDYIELSGGTYEGVTDNQQSSLRKDQAFFLSFASKIRSSLTHTKFIPTGGFKTASSMARTLTTDKADFIGLARSLTHEPHLAEALLSGSSAQAKPNKLPRSTDIQLDAALEQVRRMGEGLPVLDFSDEEVVRRWMKQREGD